MEKEQEEYVENKGSGLITPHIVTRIIFLELK